MNIGIVTSEFNSEITSVMERHAIKKAEELGINVIKTVKVPGSFDMPIMVKKLLVRNDVDAVITLGAIIKGGTQHDELIAKTVADRLTALSVEFEKPVTLGIIGPGATWEQASERAEEYAERALVAAAKLAEELKKFEGNFIKFVSSASLPTEYGNFKIFGFKNGKKEHVAVVNGDIESKRVLVRVHSKCLTGDTFSSMRCDCNAQLRESLKLIGANGGILIYLDQEGRGIGLLNKLRAYELQDGGMDIAETNEYLGFDYDERDHSIAAEILKFFNITKITLLTNNPDKIEMLKNSGIDVERLPLIIEPNEYNVKYLETKKLKAGHLL